MDQLVVGLVSTVIDIYIVILFVRMFLTTSERYDALFEMIYKATDPVVVPLGTVLRRRHIDFTPLIVIAALLLVKGMLWGSIPRTGRSFVDTLFQIYVLIIIIISGFREYYINPIASFGQRIVNPVRALAANFSRHVVTVNLLTVLFLIIARTVVALMLDSLMGVMIMNPVKLEFINSLLLILDLTTYFIFAIIINALLSWVSPDPLNPVVQLITLISAPIVDPIRRVIPPLGGMIDLSPLLAIILLQIGNAIGRSLLALL
jgi:YggT family protein